jgi:hypothetical protein
MGRVRKSIVTRMFGMFAMTKLWTDGMFETGARRDWVVGINPERRELQIDSGDAPRSYGDQGSSQLKPSWL